MEHTLAPTSAADPNLHARRTYTVVVLLEDLAAPIALRAAHEVFISERECLPPRGATGADLVGAERWDQLGRHALHAVARAHVVLLECGGDVDLSAATADRLATQVAHRADLPAPQISGLPRASQFTVRRIGF